MEHRDGASPPAASRGPGRRHESGISLAVAQDSRIEVVPGEESEKEAFDLEGRRNPAHDHAALRCESLNKSDWSRLCLLCGAIALREPDKD